MSDKKSVELAKALLQNTGTFTPVDQFVDSMPFGSSQNILVKSSFGDVGTILLHPDSLLPLAKLLTAIAELRGSGETKAKA